MLYKKSFAQMETPIQYCSKLKRNFSKLQIFKIIRASTYSLCPEIILKTTFTKTGGLEPIWGDGSAMSLKKPV